MKRLAALLAALGLLSSAAFAASTPAEDLRKLLAPAQQQLAWAAAVRGSFEQRRYLAGIPKPLVSSGEFIFARDRGVWWHTQKPFDSEVVLSRAGMRQRDAGGTPLEISAAQQPALRVVADVFLSLFALDLSLLAENFEIAGTPRGHGGWRLELTPRAGGALGSALKQVAIFGAGRVERVELLDARGDRSEIVLRDAGRGSGALSAEEAARF